MPTGLLVCLRGADLCSRHVQMIHLYYSKVAHISFPHSLGEGGGAAEGMPPTPISTNVQLRHIPVPTLEASVAACSPFTAVNPSFPFPVPFPLPLPIASPFPFSLSPPPTRSPPRSLRCTACRARRRPPPPPAGPKDAFIFADGTVVLWGLDHSTRDEVLGLVSAFRENDGAANRPKPVIEVLQLRKGEQVRVPLAGPSTVIACLPACSARVSPHERVISNTGPALSDVSFEPYMMPRPRP